MDDINQILAQARAILKNNYLGAGLKVMAVQPVYDMDGMGKSTKIRCDACNEHNYMAKFYLDQQQRLQRNVMHCFQYQEPGHVIGLPEKRAKDKITVLVVL